MGEAEEAVLEGVQDPVTLLIDLGRKFQNTHCGDSDNARTHFEKLTDLRERSSALGRTVCDDGYVSVLIGSLPTSYDVTINALTTSCNVANNDIMPTSVFCHLICVQ